MRVSVGMKETVGETGLQAEEECLRDGSCAVTREAARQPVDSRVKKRCALPRNVTFS